MSRYHSYLHSARQIIESYHGQEPFVFAIKKFFVANKKIGSKDRKQISQLCYSYFRLGKALAELPTEERILAGYLLCTTADDELLKELRPSFDPSSLQVQDIFPWEDELSAGIDYPAFCQSFLIQPDLFIRIRPGYEKSVPAKLENAGIKFESVTSSCIALPNSSKIVRQLKDSPGETIIALNKEAVVQDYSSQQVAGFLPGLHQPLVWDCCAASGGKSLLVYDTIPGIDLTVSDIRENILINLRKRFREAGITNYKSFVADLISTSSVKPAAFNLVVADVPCTGSGTWGRTPEQLFYFQKDKINEYAAKQKRIVSGVVPALKPGGYLLYITCSVFKKENEEAAAYMQEELDLDVVNMKLLTGYSRKADTLFAALLQKRL